MNCNYRFCNRCYRKNHSVMNIFTDKSFWTSVLAVVVGSTIFTVANDQFNKARTSVPKAVKENV